MTNATRGLINGFIGILIFSASLPATRVAIQQFDPVFLTVARAAIAGALALGLLLAFREKRPARADVAPLALLLKPASFAGIGTPAWLGLAYVSVFSMLIGFVFWYRGLAQGGIAAVGQLQLLQPFFGLALAATLLGEPVSILMLVVTVAIIACVVGARKFAR